MSIENQQSLLIDLNYSKVFQPIKMKQYDKNTREINITLTDGNVIFQIPPTAVAKFQATKPDGKIVFRDCSIANNVITYLAQESVTSVAGTVKCEIGIYDPGIEGTEDDQLIQSTTFNIVIEESAMDRNAVESSDDFQSLTIMINTVTGTIAHAEAVIIQTETATTNANNATALINSTNQTITDAENIRISNENNRINTEAIRITQESDRVSQETSRINAEGLRVTAEDARGANESTRVVSENNRGDAELARSSAEAIRITNEANRETSEDTRITNEDTRISSENIRIAAESSRVTDETNRANAETGRVSTENLRVVAETTRDNNEDARILAETDRVTVESIRVTNEDARITNETNRVNAETSRDTAEDGRVSAENIRVTSETNRNDAETIRIANEELRIDYKYVTQDQYNALPLEDQNNPKYVYEITDSNGEVSTELQNLITNTLAAKDSALAAADAANQAATTGLPDIGIPGSYTKVTTDVKGRVVIGETPTAISDLGITDVYNKTEVDTKVGDLATLSTIDKSDIVNAINEVNTNATTAESNAKTYTDDQIILAKSAEITQDKVVGLTDLSTDVTNLKVNGTNSQVTLSQDYKAIFPSGTGKDNLLVDQDFSSLVSGQSNIKLEGLTANNSVINGDFNNGLTGWINYNSTSTINNGILSNTADNGASNTLPFIAQQTGRKGIANHKYYLSGSLKVTNNNSTGLRLHLFEALANTLGGETLYSPIININYHMSDIIALTANITEDLYIVIGHYYSDSITAIGKTLEIQNVMFIDLTVLFGVGNEPTKEQCDYMFDHYINGLQGVNSGKLVSVSKNLFNINNTITYSIGVSTNVINDTIVITKTGISIAERVHILLEGIFKGHTYTFKTKVNGYGGYTPSIAMYGFNPTNLADGVEGLVYRTIIDGYLCSTFTPTVDNLVWCLLLYPAEGTTDTGITTTFSEIQVEEGVAATTYESYQSSEFITTLSQQLHRLPNGVVDTVEEVNGVKQVKYRTKEYTINGTETCSDTGLSNTNYITFTITVPMVTKFILSDKFIVSDSAVSSTYDGEAIQCDGTSPTIYIRIAKSKLTTADITGFKNWLVLNNVKLIYQLATPLIYKNGENGFSQTGNIEAYPNGTIYQEPVTIKESTNAKTFITYNLSDKAIIMQNNDEISAINKQMSNWKSINPWITPTLLNGWVNYGGAYNNASYYKDEFGIVHLRGVIKSGTNSAMFVLPTNYRPYKYVAIPIVSTTYSFGALEIDANGNVYYGNATNTFVSLENVSFRAIN